MSAGPSLSYPGHHPNLRHQIFFACHNLTLDSPNTLLFHESVVHNAAQGSFDNVYLCHFFPENLLNPHSGPEALHGSGPATLSSFPECQHQPNPLSTRTQALPRLAFPVLNGYTYPPQGSSDFV